MSHPVGPQPVQRRFEMQRGEHLSVVWIRPASYRLCSYGEVGEYQRWERWLTRRIVLGVLSLVIAYPLSVIFWRAVMRVGPGFLTTWLAPVVDWLTLPLTAYRVIPGAYLLLGNFEEWCVAWLSGSGRLELPALTAGLMVSGGVLLSIAYALSPVGYWLLARFFGFAHLPLTSLQMEIIYKPLNWLAEQSRTVRDFYEAYFDLKEELD